MQEQASSQNSKALSHKLGKAQAREKFAPLVEALALHGGVVEITDYGKVSAVMLGYKDYLELVARSNHPLKSMRTLSGSGVLIGNVNEATSEVSRSVKKSIDKTVEQL
ncbi:MAG: hypothetical protein K2X81_25850 [Candidatus Obscuribacterales bacterium]|jgi:TRAP-type uncharacterized transport system substrate-binding protein|nr:hypothetical protein [Candidatus Obscuribacterales bacterium]